MFTLPPLPYGYEVLEPYIDTETMKIHHDKHHAAYIDNLNKTLEGHDDLLKMDINELITSLDKVPEEIRTKVRNNAGGHANHSLFWKIMGPKADGAPKGELSGALKSVFGNFNAFQEKFSQAGLGRFGSGWVWLIAENGKLEIEDSPNQDTPAMDLPRGKAGGRKVILGLDVWEHAYYLKYQNRRAEYIQNWWNVVNWRKVEELFENV